MLNKKQMQRIQSMLSNTNEPLLVRSLGDGQTMITGCTDNFVTNIILATHTHNPFTIYPDQLNKLKAYIKDFSSKDECSSEELAEMFGSAVPQERKDTDSVMAETSRSELQIDFHVDFKLLEQCFKATKEKSSIIRITKYDNDRMMISTQEGAVSCLGVYRES